MTAQDDLAGRIRDSLAGRAVREVRMFGGRAFLVDDRLAVSVGSAGDLLVRVDPDAYDHLLDRGAIPAAMGRGRPMGRGWMVVPAGEMTDDDVAFWVSEAIDAGIRRRVAPG